MGIMYLIYFAELTKKEISISFQRSEVEREFLCCGTQTPRIAHGMIIAY